jgi:hypothetical protein
MAVAVLLLPEAGWGALRATVQATGPGDPNGCGFWGDGETLSITDNGGEILQKRYCSAYGKSKATIVTDARARNYVLLEFSEGHGTNAWIDYLTIYELTDGLTERRRVVLSEGAGPTSRWLYDLPSRHPARAASNLR